MSFPVSYRPIKSTALSYAEKKGFTEFRASNGWLYKFQKRNGIGSKSRVGESASADKQAAREFSAQMGTYQMILIQKIFLTSMNQACFGN